MPLVEGGGRTGSLLVVDDEESVAVTMGAILEMDGYEVAISTTGADALRKLREREFDLVLTDLRLDDTDGLSIVTELRKLRPDTVAIMLTGFASLESAIKALREGAYDYLIKPCDVDELRVVVARGIERRQLGLQLLEARDRFIAISCLADHFMASGGERVAHDLTHESGVVDYEYTGHQSTAPSSLGVEGAAGFSAVVVTSGASSAVSAVSEVTSGASSAVSAVSEVGSGTSSAVLTTSAAMSPGSSAGSAISMASARSSAAGISRGDASGTARPPTVSH